MVANSGDRYTQSFEFKLSDDLSTLLLPDDPLIRSWRIEIVSDDGETDGFDVISADDLAKAFHCEGTHEVVRKLEHLARECAEAV